MSRYDSSEKDEIYYEIKNFIQEYSLSELLSIISDIVAESEEQG